MRRYLVEVVCPFGLAVILTGVLLVLPLAAKGEAIGQISTANCEAYGQEHKLVAFARDSGVTEAQMEQILGFMMAEIHPSIVPIKHQIIVYVYRYAGNRSPHELAEQARDECYLTDGLIPRLKPL